MARIPARRAWLIGAALALQLAVIVTLVLAPDTALDAKRLAEERADLDAVAADLDEAGNKAITDEQEELRRIQETPDAPEALATIPGLALADLPREEAPIAQEVRERDTTT